MGTKKQNKVDLTKMQKVKMFFRKYAYAITASACGLLVVVAFTVSILVKNSVDIDVDVPVVDVPQQSENNVQEPSRPVASNSPLILMAPVEGFTIGMQYAVNGHVYNKTLNEWAVHKGVDLIAPAGSQVVASADGEVGDITYSVLDGTVVEIVHADGIKTVYKSLSNEVLVAVGDKVNAGQAIGVVSDSAGSEVAEGAHVHFEVYKDGQVVDPNEYIFDK